mgnify:CR=1 FL=1
MSIVVRIPTLLRRKAEGKRRMEVSAYSFEALLEEMEAAYPGITERLRDGQGEIRRTLNFYVNGENIRYLQGLGTPLKDGDEVSILPAIAGGGKLIEGGSLHGGHRPDSIGSFRPPR